MTSNYRKSNDRYAHPDGDVKTGGGISASRVGRSRPKVGPPVLAGSVPPPGTGLLLLLALLATACGGSSFKVELFLKFDPSVANPALYSQPGNVYTIYLYDTANDQNPIWWDYFDGTKTKSISVPAELADIPVWIRVLVQNQAGAFLFDGYIGGPSNMFYLPDIQAQYGGLQITLISTQ